VSSAELPVGTVTFLFTDIQGSTQLLKQLGGGRYGEALAASYRPTGSSRSIVAKISQVRRQTSTAGLVMSRSAVRICPPR